MTGSTISGNQALGGAASTDGQGVGGGLYLVTGSHATIPDTLISGNHASTSDDDVFGDFDPWEGATPFYIERRMDKPSADAYTGVHSRGQLFPFCGGRYLEGKRMDELMPDSLETQDLLRKVRAGDRQALEQLFAEHRPQLRRFVEMRLDPKLRDRTTFYRHDLAYAEDPTIPKNPHRFLFGQPTSASPLVAAIERGYQEQIETFFESDGATIIHPEPARFFEVPIQGPLPEDLNYIP